MMQAVWLTQRDADVRYEFINRRPADRFTGAAVELIRARVDALCELRLTEEELRFLGALDLCVQSLSSFCASFSCGGRT